jgi:FkbM family methyltransferase
MAQKGAPVVLSIDGFNALRMCRSGPMVYNRNDQYVGASLEKYGEYSWLEHELFAQIVEPNSVVVEAGANIGVHTVGLAKLVGEGGAVLAFEPQRLAFQTLCANLALNQCTNVLAYQLAVGANHGELLVPSLDPRMPQNFGGLSLAHATQGETVPVRTLDEYTLPSCRLIKVDVEGMERDVLLGAQRMIARHRPYLYLENDRKDLGQALLELIFSLGYDAYWHVPPLFNPDNFAGDAENIFPGLGSINMLCVPSEARMAVDGLRRCLSPDETWTTS